MRSFLNFTPECYPSPLHTYYMPKKRVVVPKEEARGVKPGPERVGAGPRSHSKSSAQVRLPGPRPATPPPPRQAACVARLVPTGYPALTWCQSLPGPAPGWGLMGQEFIVLMWWWGAPKAQGGCWLPTATPPSALTGLPPASHQQTG